VAKSVGGHAVIVRGIDASSGWMVRVDFSGMLKMF
jgi:hypothetical protein